MIRNAVIKTGGGLPPGLQLLLNYPTTSNVTKAYVNLAATGSGTSGTNTITAASTETNLVQAGQILRIGGTDTYTVSSVSTVTITTVETLSTNYVAQAMALDRGSQWNDTSGQGNHVTQATGLNRPIFSPNYLNGHAAFIGDGASFFSLPSALLTFPSSDSTIFIVAKRNSETALANSLITAGVTGVSLGYQMTLSATSGNLNYRNGTSTLVRTGGTNTNNQIFMGIRNGIIQRTSINNGTEATDNNATNPTTSDFAKLFSGDSTTFAIGSISKVMLWKRVLSNSERVQVYRMLANETGITIS